MLLLLLAACYQPPEAEPREPLTVGAGSPIAGVAEGLLDLPVGAPLGGYSSRCNYLGGDSKVDQRKTPYTVGFVPSVGVHTPAMAQVLWLEAGDGALVLARFDAIYSSDAIIDELEQRLSAATGWDLRGRVVLAASHTHHAVANFTPQEGFFLGGDRHDEEIFQRLVGDLERLALEAWESRQPAAVGMSIQKDWDPSDTVYRDRRNENNELAFFEDIPAGSYKDPYLWLLRVDTAAGEPLGLFHTFGMHGTLLDGDNPLISTDSTGGVQRGVEEMFDQPVVVGHFQGGGGDASPAGTDDGFARTETLGEYAAPLIYALWENTPTSTAPIRVDSISRGISLDHSQIGVDRPYGRLVYSPLQEMTGYAPDDLVYDDQGQIITPIDEFNAPYGGVFCGYDDPLLSSGTIGSQVFPYDGCMDIGLISGLIFGLFGLDVETIELPLAHMVRAQVTGTLFDGIALRTVDGEETTDRVLVGFLPGETTSMYAEQFRRRAMAELGIEHAWPVGYAQDHEGYLLIPEDWLLGGYEPNITFWGPLGAEHMMEGLLTLVEEDLQDELHEPADPLGLYPTTSYVDWALGTVPPDLTPDAGTWASALPEELYTPLRDRGLEPTLSQPTELRRVQDVIQLVWNGGDPMVDSPVIQLQRQEEGAWVDVLTRSGRPVGSDRTDVLLAWHPDPLYPVEVEQTHTWWAAWQAVDWGGDRAGLPEGTYRLRIQGERYVGGSTSWPWASEAYELSTEPFEVLPAELSLSMDGDRLWVSLAAPSHGWRLIDLQGRSNGDNPLVGASLWWEKSDGSLVESGLSATTESNMSVFDLSAAEVPADAVGLVVLDAFENRGSMDLPEDG